ncbi:MAG: hypothetical protein EHM28_04615, partial [Spirochaetaceae bacterium]
YYSGVLELDADGRVRHNFAIDQFNGKLRIMVLSARSDRFGSAEKNVTVSDPIVIAPGIPRVMGLGDTMYLPVTLYNKTGKAGTFNLTLATEGPLAIQGDARKSVQMGRNAQEKVQFTVRANQEAGKAVIRLRVEGNNEYSVSVTELAVRPLSTVQTMSKQGVIQPGQKAEIELPGGYLDIARSRRLMVSGDSLVRMLGPLNYLIGYPYGCTEQSVSAAFPMLYLKEIAAQTGQFNSNAYLIDRYIDVVLKKLESRLLPDAEFAFWDGGQYGYTWVSDYASHFILEAKRLGYPVKDELYNKILERLGLVAVPESRLDRRGVNTGWQSPYRLYLKALAGKPDFDAMRSVYDRLKGGSLTEEERCMMALAYVKAGDPSRAKEFLPENYVIKTLIRTHTGSFASYVRNTSLYLYALSSIERSSGKMNYLSNELYSYLEKTGRFGNTQDTAWALLALSAAAQEKNEAISVSIILDGKQVMTLDGQRALSLKELDGKKLVIQNTGGVACYFGFEDSGIPKTPDPGAKNEGLEITKAFIDVNGRPLDIKGVRQGDQVVVRLTVKHNRSEELHNLVFVDLLPAGFEIENTRLGSRSDLASVPANTIAIDHEEIRDDRIIVFVKDVSREMRYSYLVRAVSPGKYSMPQFFAEAMYDPAVFGRTAKMEDLVITEKP